MEFFFEENLYKKILTIPLYDKNMKSNDSILDISSAYDDLKSYINCVMEYRKYCKKNTDAETEEINDEKNKVKKARERLKKYMKGSELEITRGMPLNCDDGNKLFFSDKEECVDKSGFSDDFNEKVDKLHKIKKFAREDGNKNLFAIWFIKNIVLSKKDDIVEKDNNLNNIPFYSDQMLRREAVLYKIIYGEYNDDLFIDALLEDNGCTETNIYIDRNAYMENVWSISGQFFDMYCIRKLAKLIKANKKDKQGKTFVEKFFTYLCKNGINQHIFAYLMHDDDVKQKIGDYAVDNHIYMLFDGNLHVYALDANNTQDREKTINNWKKNYKPNKTGFHSPSKVRHQKTDNRFRILMNGTNAYGDTCYEGSYGAGITLILPYKFGEEKGEKRQKALDRHKALLKEIFTDHTSTMLPIRNIHIDGTSNGDFITADVATYITNDLNLDVQKINFHTPPIHIPGPLGNLGMKNIQDVMNGVTDKSKVKSITVSVGDGWTTHLLHPQRKARQLAQKLSDIGYENVVFKKLCSDWHGIDYQYVNDDNKDKVIKQKIRKFLIESQKKRLYFRSNNDVLVIEKRHRDDRGGKLIFSVFKCLAQEVKNLADDDKREKVVQKFNKNFNEECLCDYLRYFNDVMSVKNGDGIDIEIAGKTYTYKFVKDNVYCLAESGKTAKDMEVPDDIIQKISNVDTGQGVHKTHCTKLNDGRWFIHYQVEEENKDIGEDFKYYKENENTEEGISIGKGGSDEEKSNTNNKINTAENGQNQKHNADTMKENSSKNHDNAFMKTENFLYNKQIKPNIKNNSFSSASLHPSTIVNDNVVFHIDELNEEKENNKTNV